MKQQRKRILIVDDDPDILDMLTLFLEEIGYEVETAMDGANLPIFEQGLPDLLLLDIWLSGSNGGDICLYLKSREETRQLPIILVSANRETESVARAAGADDFVTKPFNLDELQATIERYL